MRKTDISFEFVKERLDYNQAPELASEFYQLAAEMLRGEFARHA